MKMTWIHSPREDCLCRRKTGYCPATCAYITISDFGLFSGTYKEVAGSVYDAFYYMAGGIDYYELYKYNGAWKLEPGIASYPSYRVSEKLEPIIVKRKENRTPESGGAGNLKTTLSLRMS